MTIATLALVVAVASAIWVLAVLAYDVVLVALWSGGLREILIRDRARKDGPLVVRLVLLCAAALGLASATA